MSQAISRALPLTTRDGWWRFRDALASLQSFRTSGALRGESFGNCPPGAYIEAGRLPNPWRRLLRDAEGIAYVVFSYATPIAWLDAATGVWVCVDVKFSQTTSCHQSKIFTAISQLPR
jgi:hypothetical protein